MRCISCVYFNNTIEGFTQTVITKICYHPELNQKVMIENIIVKVPFEVPSHEFGCKLYMPEITI